MEINSQINTFSGGMNTDLDLSLLTDKLYRYAENVRLVTNTENSSGALLNLQYIKLYSNYIPSTETILGTSVGRMYYNSTVLECGIILTRSVVNNKIYNKLYSILNFDTADVTLLTIFQGYLDIINKVSIVTNYETDSVSNVYITDGETQIKVINILKTYSEIITDPTYFDLLPGAVLPPFKFIELISGTLPACTIQYCYLLFSVHGCETVTSTLSSLIPITSSNATETKKVNGDLPETITNKGCKLKATAFNDGRYEKLRVISILYIDSTTIPRIYILSETDLVDSNEGTITFEYSDTGNGYLSEISIDEFNDLVPFEFNAKSIVNKDNMLFASNVQELTWDVDYDARAYRCNKSGLVYLDSTVGDPIITTLAQIISGSKVIPSKHDCINPMNSTLLYPVDESTSEYAYGYDGLATIRGGLGKNITYRFVTMDMIESDQTPTTVSGTTYLKYNLELNSKRRAVPSVSFKSPETGSIINTMYLDSSYRIRNYSDPFFVSNFLSYQRDETYRFGIVLYNRKNVPSPVHWIGDIRFPAADVPGYEPFTFNGSVDNVGNYELVSHPLGILFIVSNLPSDAIAYEIVRCNRSFSDRSVVTQGILNKTMHFTGWSDKLDSSEIHYDLSSGPLDRRPYVMPTFSTGNPFFCQGYFETNKCKREGKQSLNPADCRGIFDFVSADICYNKTTSEQIVTQGMLIVPLYCAASATVGQLDGSGYQYRFGIPFTTITSNSSTDTISNPFGGIVRGTSRPNGSGFDVDYGVFDGVEESAGYPSGGVCKYYLFFSKIYSRPLDGATYKDRAQCLIEDAISPTNINPYVASPGDAKDYTNNIGTVLYINYSIGSYQCYGPHGVNMVLSSPEVYSKKFTGIFGTPIKTDAEFNSVLFVNIKRNVTLYGGNNYVNRLNSIYNNMSSYVKSDYGNYNNTVFFGGDTYLGVLDYAHTLLFTKNDVQADNGKKRYVAAYIPLESSVNVYYRLDLHFSLNCVEGSYTRAGSADIYYTTEPGLLNTNKVNKYPMYNYNSVYSSKNGSKHYISPSLYSENNVKNRNRITCSEVKTNNEITDSWTKFKFANYLDVDSLYGQITNLKIFNDKLYFFLDLAVGIASINERSLITDDNTNLLVLGTGTVLNRFDYIITLNGSSVVNDTSITKSSSTMYWFDLDKNELCAIGSGFDVISKSKGVLNYLNSVVAENKLNVNSFYDKKYNEVWFRVYDKSLIYNELLGVFTSFYMHNPNWLLPLSNKLVTITNDNYFYIHNLELFTSDNVQDRIAKIQFVVNKDYSFTKVYDNVQFDALLVDDTNDSPLILKDIIFTTKTQVTDAIDYNTIENREDTYRFYIPREHVEDESTTNISNASYNARMRGKYLICDYTFDCNNDRLFKLPYLKTTYRYSMV